MNKPYVSLYANLKNGIKVYLVDGEWIRNNSNVEWIGGGNHYANPELIPANEIWLENGLTNKDADFILVHEKIEAGLMAKGIDYQTAHKLANSIELYCRRHPADLQTFLDM